MIRTVKNIPRRVFNATRFTLSGLRHVYRKEESFRVEMLVLAALVMVLALVSWPAWKKVALIAAYLLVPLAEIVNSCLEDLCDLITKERHPVVKNVKDMGSAAVLFAIAVAALSLAALVLC